MKKSVSKPLDLAMPGIALLWVLIAFASLAIVAGVTVLALRPGF